MRVPIRFSHFGGLRLVLAVTLLMLCTLSTVSALWGQESAAGNEATAATSSQSNKPAPPLHIVPMTTGPDGNATPAFAKLIYMGGPVISNAQIIVVFWGTGVNATTQSGIGNFYQSILTSNYYSLLGEYDTTFTGGSGQIIGPGAYAGAYTINPSVCGTGNTCTIDDTQIQTEISAQINASNLPVPAYDNAGNVNTVYMVYFPGNVTISLQGSKSCQVFCAYHSSYTFNDKTLAYGILPDLGGACAGGCGSSQNVFDNLTSVSSHELAEAATDPNVGQNVLSWYDNTNGEIGDICNAQQATLASSYTVQKLWSNAFSACISAVPSFQVGAPVSASVGSSFTMTVTTLTSAGVTDTSYTGTIHFVSTDPAATLPSDYTFSGLDGGVHTFPVTFNTAGAQTITGLDKAYGGRSGVANVTVSPGTTHFSVSAPGSGASGVAFNVTVTALDQNNQTVAGYNGTVHFSSSDAGAVLPANSTLTGGVGVFSVTLKTLGAQTITATDSSNGTINGSAGVTVVAGPATHFTVTAPTPDTAGVPFSVTVTAFDANNNVATGYTGTVKFGSSDGAAVLPPNSSLTNGVGGFSVTLNTQGNQSVTATDTANALLTGTVTVNVLASGVQVTSTTITSTLNPSTYGVPVTFSATVTAASGIPQGVVVFKAGSVNLGRVNLLNGVASVTTAFLKPGTATVTATYNGNAHFLTSSASLVQVQNKALTGTDISSSANPSSVSQMVTFTVVVDSIGGVPSGNVTFLDGSTVLVTVPLNGGTAAYSTSSLTAGTHRITANYKGNANFVASGASLTQLVH